VVADSLGGAWKLVPLPDSLQVITFDASADGRRAVFLGQAGDHRLVVVTGLSGEGMHVVATLPTDEPRPGVTWGAGDTLYLSRWLDADETPSLWRVLASGGGLTRVAVLPVSCFPISIRVSLHAPRAVCALGDFRGDIWVYRVPGVAR
jgi:hypothetical protein